jgi:hypothetical protein
MKLKLNKMLASALVTGLMAIGGHAVAGNAVESAAFPSDDPRCTALYNALQVAFTANSNHMANLIMNEMKEIHCY